jgi:hypothetical protein
MQLTRHHDAMQTLSLSESLKRYFRSSLGRPVEESQEATDVERKATGQSSDKEHGPGDNIGTAAMEEQHQHWKCHVKEHLAPPQIVISESSYLSDEVSRKVVCGIVEIRGLN